MWEFIRTHIYRHTYQIIYEKLKFYTTDWIVLIGFNIDRIDWKGYIIYLQSSGLSHGCVCLSHSSENKGDPKQA